MLGGGVALLVWTGIVMRPVLEQRQERPFAPVDLGTVVSESALLDHAPLYLAAIVVCGAEIVVYVIIGALLGWKHGGGLLPMLILFSLVGWTWRAITKSVAPQPDSQNDRPHQSPPEADQ